MYVCYVIFNKYSILITQYVYVQPCPLADNMTLPAFAAARRAAAQLLLTAGRAAIDRSPGCRVHISKPAAAAGEWDRQTDRQTDARMDNCPSAA